MAKRNKPYVTAHRAVKQQVAKQLASLRKQQARTKAGTPDREAVTAAVAGLQVVKNKVANCCMIVPRTRS